MDARPFIPIDPTFLPFEGMIGFLTCPAYGAILGASGKSVISLGLCPRDGLEIALLGNSAVYGGRSGAGWEITYSFSRSSLLVLLELSFVPPYVSSFLVAPREGE